jgi:hypothetical protein
MRHLAGIAKELHNLLFGRKPLRETRASPA